ncbi:MAG: hypothetical protein Q4B29_01350 [Candidatus Saccharibacteria bacterium]|nr:hypothetical protein [Candidatus Saccharibacteria bacterium]
MGEFDERMIINFAAFIETYKKIDKWWINNVEIPIACLDPEMRYDEESAMSGDQILCDMIMDTIYGDKKYREALEKIIVNSVR